MRESNPPSQDDLFASLGASKTKAQAAPPAPGASDALELSADDLLEAEEGEGEEGPTVVATRAAVFGKKSVPPPRVPPSRGPVTSRSAALGLADTAVAPPAPATNPLPVEAEEVTSEDPPHTEIMQRPAALALPASPAPAAGRPAGAWQASQPSPTPPPVAYASAPMPAAPPAAQYASAPMPAAPPAAQYASAPMPAAQPYASAPMAAAQPYGSAPMPAAQPYGSAPMPAAHGRPASIAPVAVDVGTPRFPGPPRGPSPSTASYVIPAGVPRGPGPGAFIGGGIAALLMISVLGGVAYSAVVKYRAQAEQAAAVAESSSFGSPAPASTEGFGSPSEPSSTDVSALPSVSPASSPRTGGTSSRGTSSHGTSSHGTSSQATSSASPHASSSSRGSSSASSRSTSRTSQPSAPSNTPAAEPAFDPNAPLPPPGAARAAQQPATPAPAAAPRAPAAAPPTSGVGTIHVDPGLRAIMIDGSYRRVVGGTVTVPCGARRVKAGMGEMRTVNVPCGGAVAF